MTNKDTPISNNILHISFYSLKFLYCIKVIDILRKVI